MPTFYALHVNREHLAGTLKINDVSLLQWSDPKAATSAHAINAWVTGRSNRISVVFDWPKDVMALRPKFEATVLATTRPDQSSDEGAVVIRFAWPSDPLSAQRPPEVGFAFEATDPPPSGLWSALAPIDLNDQARAGANAALLELQGALARRDLERAAAILDFKAVDLGRAMYLDPDQARTSQRDFLEGFLSEPDFAMAPLEPTAIELQLVAERRLVWASRPGGAPVLQSSLAKSPRLLLPVYLAPLRGRWTVVR
jgi:hypothetical protein